jgi:hypothetical protein
LTATFGASADDIKAGFELEADAKRFWQAMSERLAKFGLELHEGKTRLLEFGPLTLKAAAKRQRRGQGKPETLRALGLHLHQREISARRLPAAAQKPV